MRTTCNSNHKNHHNKYGHIDNNNTGNNVHIVAVVGGPGGCDNIIKNDNGMKNTDDKYQPLRQNAPNNAAGACAFVWGMTDRDASTNI